MSMQELKQTLRQTAKRILKTDKPSGAVVRKEIESAIIDTFNLISSKAAILLHTAEVEEIFAYARRKSIECFIALGVTYVVPK